jgi:hypothetical protein
VRTGLRHDVGVRDADLSASGTLTLCARVVGAGLVLASGWIRLELWLEGYRDIRWIGPLYLIGVVLAALLALSLLLAPERWLPVLALLAGLFEGGCLSVLMLSLTVGLLGFSESWAAPLVVPTVLIEGAGFLLFAGFGTSQLLTSRQDSLRGRPWRG